MFCLGLILCTRGGVYALQLMDAFAASYTTLLIGLIESIVIAWIYGVDRFLNDIKGEAGPPSLPHDLLEMVLEVHHSRRVIFILIFTRVDFKPIRVRHVRVPRLVFGFGLDDVLHLRPRHPLHRRLRVVPRQRTHVAQSEDLGRVGPRAAGAPRRDRSPRAHRQRHDHRHVRARERRRQRPRAAVQDRHRCRRWAGFKRLKKKRGPGVHPNGLR